MKYLFIALLGQLLWAAFAAAQPITESGVEVDWFTPKVGAVMDPIAGTEHSVGLSGPRRLPGRGFLAARLRPGELAWVHLDGDPEGASVHFAFLSGGADGVVAMEAVPERRAPGDFVFTAPVSPTIWLGLSVRDGKKPPLAQIWVGGVRSPGFRWELWEDLAKAWAKNPKGLPPSPPDLGGQPPIEQLLLIRDAVALAQAESLHEESLAVSALLRAEALMADLPVREFLFPYFRRKDLTKELANSKRLQKIEDQHMFELHELEPLRFSLQGPCVLRIEARGKFDKSAAGVALPMHVSLSAGGRVLAQAIEEARPSKPSESGPVSTLRRLVFTAAPGWHSYELKVRGGPTWISVISHTRSTQVEDFLTHSEDLPWLLKRARGKGGVLTDLLAAEASFLALDDANARVRFQAVMDSAANLRLRAFALRRLAALSLSSQEASAATMKALSFLGEAADDAAVRLRNVIVAEHLGRIAADAAPRASASKEVVALLRHNPGALPHVLGLVGPLLRHMPNQRPLALALLAEAQRGAPFDESVRHSLTHEWFTGSRWVTLPVTELTGAKRVELLAPPQGSMTCTEAIAAGTRAYAKLSEEEVSIVVPKSLAPPPKLRRFQMIALRSGAPHLGWAELTIDAERARLPLVMPSEPIPFALAAGQHKLSALLQGEQDGTLLLPCSLLEEHSYSVQLAEHRYSELGVRGAKTRAMAMDPGTMGFLGLLVRASPELVKGRLIVRTEQGILGGVDVYGHGIDTKVIGRKMGPAMLIVIPLPADTRIVEIAREDEGPPILISALLRHSLSAQRNVDPSLLEIDPEQGQLERLRQATRRLRRSIGVDEVARARIHRAEVLLALDAFTWARRDLLRALPALDAIDSTEHVRMLLALISQPLLAAPRPKGRTAVILSGGANLDIAGSKETLCVALALSTFATEPNAGRSAAAKCSGQLGHYVAARLEELSGSSERAARHYAEAYLQSVATGRLRPSLAREAALRFAERGPGPDSQHALALATAAAEDEDPDGDRAIKRVRGLSHLRTVRGVDTGIETQFDERELPPLSLRAALADEPWDAGLFLEVASGKSSETDFQLERPLKVRVEALCDDQGELPDVAPPCNLHVEIDGVLYGKTPNRMLRAGERALVAEAAFDRGAHRIKVTLEAQNPAGLAFVHFSTNRALQSDAPLEGGGGYFGMPFVPPPLRRFVSTSSEPVQLRVQGSTALRMDILAAPGSGERSISAELKLRGHKTVQRSYPVCTGQTESQPLPKQAAFDCRSVLMIPLVYEGTYEITLRPLGVPTMALALSVYEDSPAVGSAEIAEPPLPLEEPLPGSSIFGPSIPALPVLAPPISNWKQALGTLEIWERGVFGSAGRSNPQIGDTFAETAIFYRRKLDDVPVWFRAGAFLRLRQGPGSGGIDGLFFGRIPKIQLRTYVRIQGFSQSVNGNQEYAGRLRSYLERSISIIPHLFFLPRFGFNANYQTIPAFPKLRTRSGMGSAADEATPIDPAVFNRFDSTHRTSIYGQLLLWWVPFINFITYTHFRVSSSDAAKKVDSLSGRLGLDVVLHTAELVSYYELEQYLVTDVRRRRLAQHHLFVELNQTFWVHRNHRLGLQLSANAELATHATTFIVGAFWEGSHGRGLDDYSTPETNFPQPLGRGRGILKPEETLR